MLQPFKWLLVTLLVLKTLNSLLNLLNSEKEPTQLSAGVAFGMLVGLTPFMSLHNLFIFFIVCLFRVNFSMFFLSLGIFKLIAYMIDPLFDWFGYWLLVEQKGLRAFWISITSGPVWPFFRFNNTIVMGSLATSVILWLPVFILFTMAVKTYRSRWREQIKNSKLMKALKATPLYGLYEKYQNFREKMSVFQ